MTSTSVARAARAEKKAEGDRKAADAAWRAAWWKTTMELAKVEGQTAVAETNAELAKILGQTRDHLGKRRATGKAFKSVLKDGPVLDLPTRKAIEVAVAKVPVTDEIIEMLRDSDEVRMRDRKYPTTESLRDFSARLTGTSWSVGSDEEIEKALEAKPELARKIATRTIETDKTAAVAAAKTLSKSQPEVLGRAVAKSAEATASYADVRREEAEEKQERVGVRTPAPDRSVKEMEAKVAARNAVSDWLVLVHEAQAKLHAAASEWNAIEGDLIDEDLVEANASLVEAEGDAVILRQRVADKRASLSDSNV